MYSWRFAKYFLRFSFTWERRFGRLPGGIFEQVWKTTTLKHGYLTTN